METLIPSVRNFVEQKVEICHRRWLAADRSFASLTHAWRQLEPLVGSVAARTTHRCDGPLNPAASWPTRGRATEPFRDSPEHLQNCSHQSWQARGNVCSNGAFGATQQYSWRQQTAKCQASRVMPRPWTAIPHLVTWRREFPRPGNPYLRARCYFAFCEKCCLLQDASEGPGRVQACSSGVMYSTSGTDTLASKRRESEQFTTKNAQEETADQELPPSTLGWSLATAWYSRGAEPSVVSRHAKEKPVLDA